MNATATPAFASAFFVALALESRFSFSSGTLFLAFAFRSTGSFSTGDVWHLELLRARRNPKEGQTRGKMAAVQAHIASWVGVKAIS